MSGVAAPQTFPWLQGMASSSRFQPFGGNIWVTYSDDSFDLGQIFKRNNSR